MHGTNMKIELQPFIFLRFIRHLLYPQRNGPQCLSEEAELTGDRLWAQRLTEQSVHCQEEISWDQLQRVILSVWYSGLEYISPYRHREYRFAPGAASGLANRSLCPRLFEPRTGFMQCHSTVTIRITCNQLTAPSDMESSVNFFFCTAVKPICPEEVFTCNLHRVCTAWGSVVPLPAWFYTSHLLTTATQLPLD